MSSSDARRIGNGRSGNRRQGQGDGARPPRARNPPTQRERQETRVREDSNLVPLPSAPVSILPHQALPVLIGQQVQPPQPVARAVGYRFTPPTSIKRAGGVPHHEIDYIQWEVGSRIRLTAVKHDGQVVPIQTPWVYHLRAAGYGPPLPKGPFRPQPIDPEMMYECAIRPDAPIPTLRQSLNSVHGIGLTDFDVGGTPCVLTSAAINTVDLKPTDAKNQQGHFIAWFPNIRVSDGWPQFINDPSFAPRVFNAVDTVLRTFHSLAGVNVPPRLIICHSRMTVFSHGDDPFHVHILPLSTAWAGLTSTAAEAILFAIGRPADAEAIQLYLEAASVQGQGRGIARISTAASTFCESDIHEAAGIVAAWKAEGREVGEYATERVGEFTLWRATHMPRPNDVAAPLFAAFHIPGLNAVAAPMKPAILNHSSPSLAMRNIAFKGRYMPGAALCGLVSPGIWEPRPDAAHLVTAPAACRQLEAMHACKFGPYGSCDFIVSIADYPATWLDEVDQTKQSVVMVDTFHMPTAEVAEYLGPSDRCVERIRANVTETIGWVELLGSIMQAIPPCRVGIVCDVAELYLSVEVAASVMSQHAVTVCQRVDLRRPLLAAVTTPTLYRPSSGGLAYPLAYMFGPLGPTISHVPMDELVWQTTLDVEEALVRRMLTQWQPYIAVAGASSDDAVCEANLTMYAVPALRGLIADVPGTVDVWQGVASLIGSARASALPLTPPPTLSLCPTHILAPLAEKEDIPTAGFGLDALEAPVDPRAWLRGDPSLPSPPDSQAGRLNELILALAVGLDTPKPVKWNIRVTPSFGVGVSLTTGNPWHPRRDTALLSIDSWTQSVRTLGVTLWDSQAANDRATYSGRWYRDLAVYIDFDVVPSADTVAALMLRFPTARTNTHVDRSHWVARIIAPYVQWEVGPETFGLTTITVMRDVPIWLNLPAVTLVSDRVVQAVGDTKPWQLPRLPTVRQSAPEARIQLLATTIPCVNAGYSAMVTASACVDGLAPRLHQADRNPTFYLVVRGLPVPTHATIAKEYYYAPAAPNFQPEDAHYRWSPARTQIVKRSYADASGGLDRYFDSHPTSPLYESYFHAINSLPVGHIPVLIGPFDACGLAGVPVTAYNPYPNGDASHSARPHAYMKARVAPWLSPVATCPHTKYGIYSFNITFGLLRSFNLADVV